MGKIIRKSNIIICKILVLSIMISMFLPMTKVQAESDAVSLETFSGKASEWDGINHDTIIRSSTLTSMKAVQSGGMLYFSVSGTGLNNGNTVFYIDSDKDGTTGCPVNNWKDSAGIDYKLVNASLFKYSTGNWEQVQNSEIQMTKTGTSLEAAVKISDLGLSESKALKVAFYKDGASSLPEASNNMMLVNEAEGGTHGQSISNLTVDAVDNEWVDITPLLTAGNGTTSVSAVICDNKLDVLIKGQIAAAELGSLWEFLYIDTDKNPETGNKPWMWNNMGAEYAVQTGILYKGDGSGGWSEVAGSGITYSALGSGANKIIEWSVPLSSLGISSAKSVNLSFYGDDKNISTGVATVNPANPSAQAQITVDGVLDDWAAVNNSVNASGVSTELYTVQDGKKLYTLVKGINLNTKNVYYIDSDNDSSTGYTIDGLWPNTGIDYIVDSSKLYKLTGSNPSTDRTLVGDVFTYFTETAVEMSLDLAQIGRTASGDMKIGYIGKGSLDIPAVSSEMASINKTITREAIANTYYPNEYYGVLNNPYMGWVPWAQPSDKEELAPNTDYPQPHKLVYAGLSWKELEPKEGIYDWEGIEKKYQFDFWAAQGSKIDLRVVLDTPASEVHRDIPDWLYEKLGGDGTQYDNSSVGKGFSPNYNNTILIAEHKKLIKALADRYKDDPRIGFIQLGSLGHWGEWHCWPYDPSTGIFPSKAVSDQYVQHYIDAFGNSKKLNMRRGYGLAKENKFGLFNDMFGDLPSLTSIGWGWLDQIQNGYTDDFQQAQPKMPDLWKYGPAGGEFANGNSLLYLTDDTIMSSLNQARLSHTSWLGPCCPASYSGGELQKNIDALLKTMGYRYVIESVTHSNSVRAGVVLPISIKINNKGVAPFYFNWPLSVSLVDSAGKTAAKAAISQDIKTWLPGRTTVNAEMPIPGNLVPGVYTLCLSIDDPATGNPGIAFANTGRRDDGSYTLDTVMVNTSGSGQTGTSSNGTTPQPEPATVSAITATPVIQNGIAKVDIDQSEINNLLDKTQADSSGVKRANIAVVKTEGVSAYECTLPAGLLASNEKRQVTLQTEVGNITLPGNMLSSGEEGKVSIELAQADKSKLSEDVQKLIGSRPLVEINLKKDGKQVAWNNENAPVTIEIPYTPSTEELKKPEQICIWYIDGAGNITSISNGRYDAKLGKVVFKVTHFSKYAVSFVDNLFNDLLNYPQERDKIDVLAAKGITNGTGNRTFSPEKQISRADFTVMLVKTLGLSAKAESNFKDVNKDAYYYQAVGTAKILGLAEGTGNNRFSPKTHITRQDAAVMTAKALELMGLAARVTDTSVLDKYKDAGSAAKYAALGLSLLLNKKILECESGMLKPREYITRAEAAVMLYNLYNRLW